MTADQPPADELLHLYRAMGNSQLNALEVPGGEVAVAKRRGQAVVDAE